MKAFLPAFGAVLATAIALSPIACSSKETEQSTYFERSISPILTTSCVRTNTGAGCHVEDAKGNALGNLDVATFAGVNKRRDLLLDYGPYGQPAFLFKNIDPYQIGVQTYDGKRIVVTTDIKHAGGSVLDPTGSGYQTLRRWIQNGATQNNSGIPPTNVERLPCNTALPQRSDFDLSKDPPRPDFATFRDQVNGVLTGTSQTLTGTAATTGGCAAGNCHGTFANSLYLTCGSTPEQIRWNYYASEEYLAQTGELSELARRPLSPAQGGAYHEGGVVFEKPSDGGYQAIVQWAQAHGPPQVTTADPAFQFFSDKVQPILVKKGCMQVQCHSTTMFHDYRIRGGSGGSFSLSATRKNYELTIAQIDPSSDDPSASRLVAKNLYRPEVCSVGGCDKPRGIVHRGGPLFEDFGASTATQKLCDDAKYDYDNGDVDKIPAYCIVTEWIRRERDVFKLAPLSAIAYVKRPVGSVKHANDFDVYAPGADLRIVKATMATDGAITLGADASVTAGCGLNVQTADIRRPQASYDGQKIAFAARSSATEPLAIYEMNADGSGCAKHPTINATPATGNGLLIHNFDPVYASPEGGVTRIVFASTRGNIREDNYDYKGPQRKPADPTKPNANLYVWEPDPKAAGQTRVRQLTFLLNTERMPSFMQDGRLIMTSEKRAPDFYQLALRRQNLDGGDYHPLYAQRGSIGYEEATNVVELSNKNFATIFSDRGTPHGGGALATFNRSIGIDFTSTNPKDYLIDPGVIDPAAPQSLDPSFFIHSLRYPDPGAQAKPGRPTTGLYTAPSMLPNNLILVSFGAASDPGSFGGDYDLYAVNSVSGEKQKLLGDAGSAEVDAVGLFGKLPRAIFRSTIDEPNGHTQIFEDKNEAEIYVVDMAVLSTLIFQNTPTGRIVDPDVTTAEVLEDMPPPLEVDSFDKGGANVISDSIGKLYVRRRMLGAMQFESDASVKFNIPGGLPIIFKVPDTPLSKKLNLPRVQREQFMFYPGEYTHQSFRTPFFNSVCGQCHGSMSGKQTDIALQPDFVTQASTTIARGKPPFVMFKPPAERGPITGP